MAAILELLAYLYVFVPHTWNTNIVEWPILNPSGVLLTKNPQPLHIREDNANVRQTPKTFYAKDF
jgi:hypothetical protein